MATVTVGSLLLTVKPVLDQVRAVADKADAAINKLNSSFAGSLVKLIPTAGPIISAIVAGCQALDTLIDALDTAVDAGAAAPAPLPTATQAPLTLK